MVKSSWKTWLTFNILMISRFGSLTEELNGVGRRSCANSAGTRRQGETTSPSTPASPTPCIHPSINQSYQWATLTGEYSSYIYLSKRHVIPWDAIVTSNGRPFGCPIIYTDMNSQCYFAHRHLNNAWHNNTHSLMRRSCLTIIASNVFSKPKFACNLTQIYRCWNWLHNMTLGSS